MKRSYNQKSGDCPDGSIENQRPTAQSGWPRNDVPRSAKTDSVRLKSRPKFKPTGRSHAPGKHCPRSAKLQASRHRARPSASRETSLAAAQPISRTTADACRPSRERTSHVRPRNHRPNLRSTTPADRESSAPTVPTRPRPDVRPIVPTTVPTPRSTRSPFEAQTYVFKPGLTLSRL
ncbi:unnamed protein product [Microthlaspi erraticum]|uniref:Uncharacterized protein n=1 Tax=Microthlaspi erraticum TaxID=1685480 RepID=A0A6D2K0K8_9BRAS|nr:unnamed protein product [Microthlaspi erraticum]